MCYHVKDVCGSYTYLLKLLYEVHNFIRELVALLPSGYLPTMTKRSIAISVNNPSSFKVTLVFFE